MKKITKFTTNEQNQRAVDCLEFNNSKNKDETCFLFYSEQDILTRCIMLDGKICPNYKGGIESIERFKK